MKGAKAAHDAAEALLRTGNFLSAAAELIVPPEFPDFKVRMLRGKGYDIRQFTKTSGSNFLKNFEIPRYYDFEPC